MRLQMRIILAVVEIVSLSSFTGSLNKYIPASGSLIFSLSKSSIKLSTFPIFKGTNLNPYDVAFEMSTESCTLKTDLKFVNCHPLSTSSEYGHKKDPEQNSTLCSQEAHKDLLLA